MIAGLAGRKEKLAGVSRPFFAVSSQWSDMDGLETVAEELPAPLAVDVLESDRSYLYVLDVPGARSESTTVTATETSLRIHVDRSERPPGATPLRVPRPVELVGELPVPRDANGDEATASLTDGVLEIELPKVEAARTAHIEIRGE